MRFLTVILALWANAASAQEFVAVDGALSDEDFYRLVACGAEPNGPCTKRLIYWPEEKRAGLKVGYGALSPDLGDWQRRLYEDALQKAVQQINTLEAGLRLIISDTPDVAIYVVPTPPGGLMENTGVEMLDGRVLALGQVAVRSRGSEIRQAVIAISGETTRRAIASVVLEELVQSLGLMTDIRSPAYRRSIFSEDSNSGTRLSGQDAMAVRRHYPPL